MRRCVLALLCAAVSFVLIAPADAQTPGKLTRPGYMIIRVLLDDGAVAAAPDPNNPNAQPQNARPVDPTRSVAAVVPYQYVEKRLFSPERSPTPSTGTNPYWPAFKHKYGHCFVYTDNTFIQFFLVQGGSYEQANKDKYDEWAKRRSYDKIHDICSEALMIGQVDQAFKYCDEYLNLPQLLERAPKTQQYENFAKAYKGLPEKLNAELPANPETKVWVGRLGAAGVKEGKHYSMLYFATDQILETERRLKLLEQNYKAFFLWHALQGFELKPPAMKMIAILSDAPSRVTEYRSGLDGLPIVSDAFFSPSHNVLMLSPERMDPNGNAFMNLARARYASGWNRDELVRGRMPTLQPGKAAEAAQMQMLAVADQYLTEEADNAAISREGCRQLLSATGLVPSNVRLPTWLENGLGFFFQRAKGPLYIREDNQIKMIVGLATGYGAPNFEQHRAFVNVKADFARSPETTLENVLTGNYYLGYLAGRDVDPPAQRNAATGGTGAGVGAPPEGPTSAAAQPTPPDPNEDSNARDARLKARLKQKADSSAWALVYYLQKTRLTGLQKFYNEIGKMPRDLALEDTPVLKAFCKAFDLNSTDGEINKDAFKTFAQNWLDYMNNVPHFDYKVPLDAATLDPFGQGANPGQGGATPSQGGANPSGNPGGNPPPTPQPGPRPPNP